MAKLKCYQKTMSNPYYKLAPIKEEIIHINPSIWMYHDIASPLERRGIIQTAGPFVSSNMKKRRKSCNKSAMKLWLVFFSFNSANSLFNDEKKSRVVLRRNWTLFYFFCVLMQFFCIRFVRSPIFGPFCNCITLAGWSWRPFFKLNLEGIKK